MKDRYLAFQIRPATLIDVEALTELHLKSFTPEEHVPVILGKNYVKATCRGQARKDQAYALVAEKEGKIISQKSWLRGSLRLLGCPKKN